jgi:hypothetical protein
MAQPVPAVPLNLPSPQRFERRPGVITAIGVISAIMALGTLLGCLFVGGWALAMYATSKMPPALFTPPTAMPVAVQPTVQQGPQEDEINGLPQAQRTVVINALNHAKPLSPYNRIRQVDALLAHSGHVMFPTVGDSSTAQSIRQDVTDSGVLPSSKPGRGPHYFIIGTGRIEIYDDHAVFRPTGSGEATSVSADEPEPVTPVAPPPPTVRSTRNAAAVKKLAMPALLVMVESLISGAGAIFLLVAAIMVLRNSLSGAGLHWIYIAIKLPLAIAAGALSWWLWNQYVAAMSVTGGSSGFASGAAVLSLVGTVLAALWPILLILMLKSQAVKEYYQTERDEALARPY